MPYLITYRLSIPWSCEHFNRIVYAVLNKEKPAETNNRLSCLMLLLMPHNANAVLIEAFFCLLISVTDSDVSGFIHNLESQDIKVEIMKKPDYMSAAPHSAAINVTGSSKVSWTYRQQNKCYKLMSKKL